MIQKLKTFNPTNSERLDIDELIELHSVAAVMRASYEKFGVEEPEWFDVALKQLEREIKLRNQANLERMLREHTNRLEALKTPGERRLALETEIERLKAKVAGV